MNNNRFVTYTEDDRAIVRQGIDAMLILSCILIAYDIDTVKEKFKSFCDEVFR